MSDLPPTATSPPEEVPFYQTITKSFKDVKITEEGVDTEEFCLAADTVVRFFDLFSNVAFKVVQDDLSSKIAKIRSRLAKAPEESRTIEIMLKNEVGLKVQDGTGSLMWLLRALNFTSTGVRRNMNNPTEELSTSMTKAYEVALKPYHGMFVRPIFYLAMKACPYRATFYPKLGTPQEFVLAELESWLDGLDAVVGRLQGEFGRGGYEKSFAGRPK